MHNFVWIFHFSSNNTLLSTLCTSHYIVAVSESLQTSQFVLVTQLLVMHSLCASRSGAIIFSDHSMDTNCQSCSTVLAIPQWKKKRTGVPSVHWLLSLSGIFKLGRVCAHYIQLSILCIDSRKIIKYKIDCWIQRGRTRPKLKIPEQARSRVFAWHPVFIGGIAWTVVIWFSISVPVDAYLRFVICELLSLHDSRILTR